MGAEAPAPEVEVDPWIQDQLDWSQGADGAVALGAACSTPNVPAVGADGQQMICSGGGGLPCDQTGTALTPGCPMPRSGTSFPLSTTPGAVQYRDCPGASSTVSSRLRVMAFPVLWLQGSHGASTGKSRKLQK